MKIHLPANQCLNTLNWGPWRQCNQSHWSISIRGSSYSWAPHIELLCVGFFESKTKGSLIASTLCNDASRCTWNQENAKSEPTTPPNQIYVATYWYNFFMIQLIWWQSNLCLLVIKSSLMQTQPRSITDTCELVVIRILHFNGLLCIDCINSNENSHSPRWCTWFCIEWKLCTHHPAND